MKKYLFLLLFLINACATTKQVWVSSNKSQQEFYRNNAKCWAMAEQTYSTYYPNHRKSAPSDLIVAIVIENQRDELYRQCMMGEGWVLTTVLDTKKVTEYPNVPTMDNITGMFTMKPTPTEVDRPKFTKSIAADIYYPLEEGLTWVYQGNFPGGGGDERVMITNLAQHVHKGKKVTPQKLNIGGQTAFVFIAQDEKGIYEFAKQYPNEFEPEIKTPSTYYIRTPLKVGTTWREEYKTHFLAEKVTLTVTNTIESLDESITVPAGTFKNCLKISTIGYTQKDMGQFIGVDNVSVESYTWYALGVGMLKGMTKEKSNHMMVGTGEAAIQLESFKKGSSGK